MNSTLIKGNYILVNKIAFGPRLPITPLSISLGNKAYTLNFAELPYFRIPGYSSVQRNDIIVFNFPTETEKPIDQRKKLIKRCVGISGDSLNIIEGIVFINGKPLEEFETVLYRYSFTNYNDTLEIRKLKPYSLSITNQEFYLTKRVSDSLERTNLIHEFKKLLTPKAYYKPEYFPHSPSFKWNLDNFGPLLIPKKNLAIHINDTTFKLYKDLIEQNENISIKQIGGKYYIDGKPIKDYKFKMDYYFVLGDNRYNSIDSRYWGLVPESHIVGKYAITLFN